ncbi:MULTISPECIES: hypothetical protein [Streptomyces]|uniref:Uncharacterized protein n=1 Tax=Streptomyces stelliscabiei TaxID=146820 RepID=A0A8I0P183_9ACTN|nr:MULTISPECIES: hypothetical protein [Streptomyces]KND41620.1 hypothetical protein IQ64_28085 [Streptomyces stelliscabiei]MBE1594436.1 hypothetical protein [Streptomyces stelliscabiei]MDX2518902.1 hypothetical protein [Streptomyces stelliscabiei]SOD83179.1 hypothetical protein SAMN06272781_8058 [Streptomyces sp. 1222.2]
MTISNRPAPSGWKLTVAYVLTGAASVLTLYGLYLLNWFPERFGEGRMFLDYRAEYLSFRAEASDPRGWEALGVAYFQIGYLFQTAAFVLLPFVVARTNRWHWLGALAVPAAAWQIGGMSAAGIVNTTFAPVLGPIAGFLALLGWGLARWAVDDAAASAMAGSRSRRTPHP